MPTQEQIDAQWAAYDKARYGDYARQTAKATDYNYDVSKAFSHGGGQDEMAAKRSTELQQRYAGESDAAYTRRMEQRYGHLFKDQGGWEAMDNITKKYIPGRNVGAWQEEARQMELAKRAKEADYEQRILDYYNKMNADLTESDPEVRNAMAMGANTAQRQQRNAGIRGGLSTRGITQSALSALNPIRQFRQGQALNALGLSNSRDMQMRQLKMQQEQDEYGRQRQQAIEGDNRNQAMWQTILSGVGTVGSIVAAPFTGGATIPGALAGGASFIDGARKLSANNGSMLGQSGSSAGWQGRK